MTDPLSSPPPSPSPSGYPAVLRVDAPLEVARWRPLVHWILVIPHLFVAGILGQVAELLSILSWFSIVFTGNQVEGISRFQVMVLRYEARVASYALWMREPYPAFEFPMEEADDGSDVVQVDVSGQIEDRNGLTVGLRFLWIIPAVIFAMVIWFVAWLAIMVGWFAVIILGRWPEGLRRFVIGALRVSLRIGAYARLVVDDYPPFSTE